MKSTENRRSTQNDRKNENRSNSDETGRKVVGTDQNGENSPPFEQNRQKSGDLLKITAKKDENNFFALVRPCLSSNGDNKTYYNNVGFLGTGFIWDLC